MQYISFQEALKASNEGKIVISWLDNETKPYNIHHPRFDQLSKEVKIDKFMLMGDEISRFDELKWTIED